MADVPKLNEIIEALTKARATTATTSPANQPNAVATDQSNRADFFRVPFTLTTKARLAKEQTSYLAFRCNPSQVSYEFPQRGGTQDVKSGKVFYYWRNRQKGTHFDLPAFTYTFQTGNIRPMLSKGGDIYLPEGLSNFYEWMSIYDEEKLLADGSPNFVVLTHSSSIFPNLYLEGFFEPGSLQTINESAEESPTFSWQAKFLVHNSVPKMNSTEFKNTFGQVFIQTHAALAGRK